MSQGIAIFTTVLFISGFVDNGSSFPTKAEWTPSVSATSKINTTSSEASAEHEVGEGRGASWWDNAESRLVWKALNDCFNEVDGPSCIKRKLLAFLDGVARKPSIPLFGGLAMEKQAGDKKRSETPLTEQALKAFLPREFSQRQDRLDQMLLEKFASIFYGRSLVLDLSAKDEGRGAKKKKKLMGYALAGVGAAALVMGAVFYKGIALLTFKAFLVAKIALVLASILAFKKIKNMKSNSDRSLSPPWAERREDSTEGAHYLAYRGQLQRPIILP